MTIVASHAAPDGVAPAKANGQAERAERGRTVSPTMASCLQAAPLAAVMVAFVLGPLILIFVVSFMDYGYAEVIPTFLIDSYKDVLTSRLTLDLYLQTFKFVVIVLCLTLPIGFTVAYFIIFHVRTPQWQVICFFACAIPFWTSSPIRMVSWIPFLGKEGLVNTALIKLGLITQPLEWLLYSQFSVCLVYVNLLTLAMIGPIANSMAKIDRSLIHAARDQGASEWQVITNIVIPLAKPGIAIGTIFTFTALMGDFYIVKQMSGTQVNTAVGAIATELDAFQYPPAAAKSIVMLVVVFVVVSAILRIVDIRKELAS